jgi:hypothetical protein
MAQGIPGWTLEALAPADAGARGARWISLSSDGAAVALTHDGDLDGGANPSGRPQAFLRRDGEAWRQLSDTAGAPEGATALDHASIDGVGDAAAFRAQADLTGANPDRSAEVFRWRAGVGLDQVSDGAAGAGADAPTLGRDGRHVAFWHEGDLTGNPAAGVPQLFLSDGTDLWQLTDFVTRGHREGPALATGGAAPAVAFISDADPLGSNPDGSWELFLWRGPPTFAGDTSGLRQLTAWAPPMSGREIYHPSISQDGTRVAFAGKGHVDVTLPGAHVPAEVYLWREGTGIARITTATAARAGSVLPKLSDDGRSMILVSQSDLAPGAPGSLDQSAELFLWTEGVGFSQLTSSAARPRLLALLPELAPAVDRSGDVAAFVAERADDPAPLALPSRRGLPYRVRRGAEDATPTATVGAPPPSATPDPRTTPVVVGRVCPQAAGRIPAAVRAQALAAPESVEGWLRPRNASLPPGPFNPPRIWLSLRAMNKPYGRFNTAVWKAGCP